jgi:hypothetical protein
MHRVRAAVWTGDKPTEGRRNDDPMQHNLMHLSMSSRAFESVEKFAPPIGFRSKIEREHLPSNSTLRTTAMSINIDTNEIVTQFQLRAKAELKRELDEVKWWEDRVRRGLVKKRTC